MQSVYAHMTADEAVRGYRLALMALRVQHIVLTLVFAAGALWAVGAHLLPVYLIFFLAIFASLVMFAWRVSRAFADLQGILWQDGDTRTYRGVLEALRGRRGGARSANLIELELAFCDYFDCRDDDALRRLSRLTFPGSRNAQRLRVFDLSALIYHDRGDAPCRDEALGRIRQMAASYRRGSRIARAATGLARELEVRFSPPGSWSAEDVRFLRERLGLAERNLNRWGLRLLLASYDISRGADGPARTELASLAGEPLVPRYERLRRNLLLQTETEKI